MGLILFIEGNLIGERGWDFESIPLLRKEAKET
jgi:hypothetical protein